MSNYDKNTVLSYPIFLDGSNLYGQATCQKLPVNGFKWVKELSKFDELFIKNYDENSSRGYFLEVDVEYPKNLLNSHKDFTFLHERKKIENLKSLFVANKTMKNKLFTKEL